MSFFHRCALGYFDPASLVCQERLRVVRPLPRDVVEPLRRHLVPTADRSDAWWDDDVLLVEHIVWSRVMPDRRAFIREVVRATGCTVVDVHRTFAVGEPWSPAQIEQTDG